MTFGVVIVTYQRPWHLGRCLRALRTYAPEVDQIVVVDGSCDPGTQALTLEHGATYLTNPHGYGHMTESRNIGWRACATELVAFVDDDAFVTPGWASAVIEAFEDPSVGGVGGRAIQNADQEPAPPSTTIGRVRTDGFLTADFDSPGDTPIDVAHVIGCNMVFRRSILEEFGGFRADYPGTALCEDTDLCLRVIAAGWRLRFAPKALVVHVGAPHARGARFDLRYQYFARRNHTQLLIRNVGFGGLLRRNLVATGRDVLRRFGRDVAAALVRPLVATAGVVTGIFAGVSARRRDRIDGSSNELEGWELERRLIADGTPHPTDDIRATDPVR